MKFLSCVILEKKLFCNDDETLTWKIFVTIFSANINNIVVYMAYQNFIRFEDSNKHLFCVGTSS